MKRIILKTISVVFLSSTLIFGCSSNPLSSKDQGLSKLAQSQTETHDGDVLIPVSSVPQPAIDAVMKAEPGGTILSAESEVENGVTVFELHVRRANGTVVEVEVNAQGKILETELSDDDQGIRGRTRSD